MGENIFLWVVDGICALLMIGIGVFNIRSRKPVGFFSGETGPEPDKVINVNAWNKKHGFMWIIYGIIIILTGILGPFITNGFVMALAVCGGYLIPIPLMIAWHRYVEKTDLK